MEVLSRHGVRRRRSDVRRLLREGDGRLAARELPDIGRSDEALRRELERTTGGAETDAPGTGTESGDAGCFFRYPEWDERLGDYLPDHVRLRVHAAPAPGHDAFYAEVLRRRHALDGRTRQAFERLRPEGVERLRRWVGGVELDYRELIASAVARRLGEAPLSCFKKRYYSKRRVR